MTIGKKAKKLLATHDDGSKECKIYNDGFLDGSEWGYNEAIRWRDPINDPPKCNNLMQIKYGDIFSNIINYGHDRYLEDMGMWDIEQLANVKVLAWRPIK